MGLDYSYEFVAPKGAVDALLEGLAKELIPEQAAVLLAALPWSPTHDIDRGRPGRQRGIAGMESATIGRIEEYCLRLVALADTAHLKAMRNSNPRLQLPQGALKFGCVWAQLTANQEWVALELTAATSGMSRDLVESAGLQQLGHRVAKAGAAFFFLHDESSEGILLSIGGEFRRVHRPSDGLTNPESRDSRDQEFAMRALVAQGSFFDAST